MATDSIMGGLFGITPEMYQQEQNQQALGQAAQLAQMSPFALAKTGIGYGANRLAGAIGGALGAEDPQLQRITAQNQILSGLDLSDPQSIATGITRAQQAGIPELAYRLLGARDEATVRQQKQLATQRQMMAQRIAMGAYDPGQAAQLIPESVVVDQAADTSYLEPQRVAPAVAPSYDISRVAPQLMALGPEGVAQLTTAKAAQKAMLPETQIVKEGETIYEKLPTGGFRELISGPIKKESFTGDFANAALTLFGTANINKIPQTTEAMNAITKQAAVLAEAKRPVTNVTNTVSNNMQKGFGETFTENISSNIKAGRAAVNAIGAVQNMQTLLDEGVRTGFGQETMLQLGRAGQYFDPEFKVKGLAGQEAFQSFSTGVILPQVKQLGVNPTDTDLKFISTGAPGLSKTPEGNKLLLSALELKLNREQDLARFTNQFLASNQELVTKNPVQAYTKFNDAFDQYTKTSPLYGPASDSLRQRFNALGTRSTGNPAARNALKSGGLTN
jgi:hypothetical protein